MPEYSSTTITPADGVKTPAMNGSTSGNYTLSALRDFILASKGQANGLASLDANGKLPSSQLPDLADDVIVVSSYASLPATGTAGKIYITADNNKMYRWNPDLATPDYVELSIDLSEYAKIVDIQDGNIQAGVAVKAFQDAMGRAIITTYATKAELSAEESSREAADTDLKSAIQGNSQRIENLEVAVSGSLVQTNILTDPPSMANVRTITNANSILPWAILKRVGARAVAWNQGIHDFSDLTKWDLFSATIDSSTSDSVTISCSTYYSNINTELNTQSGHKYLVDFWYKVSASYSNYALQLGGSSVDTIANPQTNTLIHYQKIISITTGSTGYFAFYSGSTQSGDKITITKPMVIDLTAMNEASLTADQFRAKFPASYYPYNTGEIIPLNPSGFKVVEKQKWDEVWEVGQLASDGTIDTSATNRRTTSFIEVEPNTTYYQASPNSAYDGRIEYYDKNKQVIAYSGAGIPLGTKTITTPSGCYYMRETFGSSYGTSYNHDILICLNSVTDKTYEAYKETTIDTSFTSDYKYVNENCHDYSENVLVNGVMRRKEHKGIVGSYTFTGNENWTIGDGYVYTPVGEAILPQDAVLGSQCLTDVPNATATIANGGAKRVALTLDTSTYNNKEKVQALVTGRNLYYALAYPSTPTLHDPIPNIPCEDGTTITAVTPQTDLVNAIDVPSTIAYMTKISS